MPEHARFQVAIIGAGVIGSGIARRLSRHRLRIALLEASPEAGFGVSKANSGIVHAGIHHPPGSLKATLELAGNRRFPALSRELGFPWKQTGILVIAFSDEEMQIAEHLLAQGRTNGSRGLVLLGREALLRLEPSVNPQACGALLAPEGGIVESYRMGQALVESAVKNGVVFLPSFRVSGAAGGAAGWSITAADGRTIEADYAVNAAGIEADRISALFGGEPLEMIARKGEEFLLDRGASGLPQHVLFPVPAPDSKGILVIPTVAGTLMVGPSAEAIDDRYDLATDQERLAEVFARARRLVPALSPHEVIAAFAGIRPALAGGDFLIGRSSSQARLVQAAGIQSPGLTAAPAIWELVETALAEAGLPLEPNRDFMPSIAPAPEARRLSAETWRGLVAADPAWGMIACRCETTSAAEVRDAIRAGHHTLDGIKFATRAGMGRCQGGFCTSRVLRLLAAEAGLDPVAVTKRGPGSEIIAGRIGKTPDSGPDSASPAHTPGAPDFASPAHTPGAPDSTSPAHTPGGPDTARPAHAPGPPDTRSREVDVVVIGAGAGGLAAAAFLARAGRAVMLLERDGEPGGILAQCIHAGFGLERYRTELTGPEYLEREVAACLAAGVTILLHTTALAIEPGEPRSRVRAVSPRSGVFTVTAHAVLLASGCRERSRFQAGIHGTRPAGVFTAGLAQRLANIDGLIPGKQVVILGSGDIGLIMARRMRLLGAHVVAVVELRPWPSGLARNIAQCLDDFSIPLILGHRTLDILGRDRVEGVRIVPLDGGRPDMTRTRILACDTVLLSVGLVPECELLHAAGIPLCPETGGPLVDPDGRTAAPGIYACGNALAVHDLVDHVSAGAEATAGAIERRLAAGEGTPVLPTVRLTPGNGVRSVVPQTARVGEALEIAIRALSPMANARATARTDDGRIRAGQACRWVNPAEMLRFHLAEGTVDGPLEISLEEA